MMLLTLLGLFPGLLGMTAEAPPGQVGVRRVVIRDELILRVPVRPHLSPPIEWIEQKGPKCIPATMIAGALLSSPSSIDFILRNRQRVRAKMDDDCPALDYYGQIYLQPDDQYICAKRETIRSRVGGSCRIERFRLLVPQYKQVRR